MSIANTEDVDVKLFIQWLGLSNVTLSFWVR